MLLHRNPIIGHYRHPVSGGERGEARAKRG